ncbi:MAG: hypothetical protein H6Q74_2186 [Firmicutes bacterium]|nr:hypothetical protein [Bacillota bacterium]
MKQLLISSKLRCPGLIAGANFLAERFFMDGNKVFADALVDAYDVCLEKLFGVFVSELASGQLLDDAGQRFKAGVNAANQAFRYAQQLGDG